MVEHHQSEIQKGPSKSISLRHLIDKNLVLLDKPSEFSPSPENAKPILPSQLLEFDRDENFDPASLAKLHYPVLSFQHHSARVNADIGLKMMESQAS